MLLKVRQSISSPREILFVRFQIRSLAKSKNRNSVSCLRTLDFAQEPGTKEWSSYTFKVILVLDLLHKKLTVILRLHGQVNIEKDKCLFVSQ